MNSYYPDIEATAFAALADKTILRHDFKRIRENTPNLAARFSGPALCALYLKANFYDKLMHHAQASLHKQEPFDAVLFHDVAIGLGFVSSNIVKVEDKFDLRDRIDLRFVEEPEKDGLGSVPLSVQGQKYMQLDEDYKNLKQLMSEDPSGFKAVDYLTNYVIESTQELVEEYAEEYRVLTLVPQFLQAGARLGGSLYKEIFPYAT